ncbi:MAG: DUF721 domain-containing protein [Bacteroidetes bacterium]|nr:DUF721 domain-containing protein [Bacteroidota bacterium]
MRRSNTQPLKEVLEEYLKAMNINSRLKEVSLIRSWEEIIGKTVARATTRIYIKEGVFFVHLNSSVIRKELSMIKEGLIERLNQEAGETIIKDIVLR